MSVGIGGPSIIMIFVVLCLTTLSALSLMTANADRELTNKVAASVQYFYAADNKAEDALADADAALQAGEPLDETTFIFPVSDAQNLRMVLDARGNRYEVLSRKLIPAVEWDYSHYAEDFNSVITK